MKKFSIAIFLILTSFEIISGQNINTIAGTGAQASTGDGGLAISAGIYDPKGVAVHPNGNIYFTDNTRIRMINTSGIITTVAGSASAAFSGDGGPATLAGIGPVDIAIDGAGNLYIADQSNNRVRKVNSSGIITTIAGNGTYGTGDGGPALLAGLYTPSGIALDLAGNIYISEYGCRVQKISTSGIITTVAGSNFCSHSGDGGLATLAGFDSPSGIAVDAAGNIFISDSPVNRVRKVNTSGIISTYAGDGTNVSGGDGGPATSAQISSPLGLEVDAAGNLYITDSGAHIRKVITNGIISSVVGNGISSFSGDGGPATLASIQVPRNIAIDGAGNLFFSDEYNRRIRKVCYTNNCPAIVTGTNIFNKNADKVIIYPNPSNGIFKLTINDEIQNGELIIFNLLGEEIYRKQIINGSNEIIMNSLSTGLYNYILLNEKDQIINGKLAIE